MKNKLWLAIDAAAAGALVAVLMAVVSIDAALTVLCPSLNEEQTAALTPADRVKHLRLAVSEPFIDPLMRQPWDDVGALLSSLGDGYKYDTVTGGDLRDPDKLRQYDVVFFSCGHGGVDPALTDALRAYVSQGGVLYASDWRYAAVAQAFPDLRAPELQGDGYEGLVTADVVDPGLREALKRDQITLRFEMRQWKTAAFKGDRVKVLLRGEYRSLRGMHEAPLLVKFSFGKGSVIFTSYHHGHQMDDQEKQLLKYLVFSTVVARVEQELETIQFKNQFSPAKSNLFSASQQSPKASYLYDNQKLGKLRFDLAFEDRGAELKLTVTSPRGKVYEKRGTSSLSIEIPEAELGEWRYTVTALQVPYENFAYLVSVSHGKK